MGSLGFADFGGALRVFLPPLLDFPAEPSKALCLPMLNYKELPLLVVRQISFLGAFAAVVARSAAVVYSSNPSKVSGSASLGAGFFLSRGPPFRLPGLCLGGASFSLFRSSGS